MEAQVIMIPNHGKPPKEVSSYRFIFFLPVISKLFEKMLSKRMKPIIEENNLMPSHQFGFTQPEGRVVEEKSLLYRFSLMWCKLSVKYGLKD